MFEIINSTRSEKMNGEEYDKQIKKYFNHCFARIQWLDTKFNEQKIYVLSAFMRKETLNKLLNKLKAIPSSIAATEFLTIAFTKYYSNYIDNRIDIFEITHDGFILRVKFTSVLKNIDDILLAQRRICLGLIKFIEEDITPELLVQTGILKLHLDSGDRYLRNFNLNRMRLKRKRDRYALNFDQQRIYEFNE